MNDWSSELTLANSTHGTAAATTNNRAPKQAKGQLAPGTLGRAYFDFVNGHGLPFPGERKAVAERGVWHDLSHVLGGYDITPIDEALVVSFIAGYRNEDPFFWLFTIALQFQVGIRISPFFPGLVDRIEPRAFVLHHRRVPW